MMHVGENDSTFEGESEWDTESSSPGRQYGASRSHGWSGTTPPPADWYLQAVIEDLSEEFKQLRQGEVYSTEELRVMRNRLVDAIDSVLTD